jgi:hypothetical protein
MVSYYVWRFLSGNVPGASEISALQDGTLVSDYLADWRFLNTRIATLAPNPVIVHVEPDLWGYAESVNEDPTMIAVALSSAGASECAGLPNNLNGFAECMIHISRAIAPNALLGFHASAWGSRVNALFTTAIGFDLNAHADRTAAFYRALGATDGDLIVLEISDRDAGFDMRWFDATDATVPNFARALAWQQRLAAGLNLPTLYAHIPYGHTGLPNVCNQYADNRVEYFFAHSAAFAAAGLLGISFGGQSSCATVPSTDNGFFIAQANAYFSTPQTCLCGATSCP